MFSWRVSKVIIVFLGLSVLTIGFLVFWLSYDLPTTKRALAVPGSIEDGWVPLRGWAWVGAPNACDGAACGNNPSPSWISFNCRSQYSYAECQDSSHQDYWVAVNENTGGLDGYAWSDNVGWIDFNPSWADITAAGLDTSFYVNCDNGCNGAGDHCSACYNKTARQFHGWARVLSEADTAPIYDNGWIKLDNLVFNNVDYGVQTIKFDSDDNDIEEATNLPEGGAPWGDISGWAWNGANANLGSNSLSGLGWISFNCVNEASCSSVNSYKVTGRPKPLGVLQVTRIDGDDSHGLSVDWTNGYPAYGATYYEVWRQNGRCSNSAEDCDSDLYCPGGTCNLLAYDKKQTTSGGPPWPDQPLNLFVTYKYVVRACNIFGCSRTTARSLQTSPIEAIHKFKATPICAAPATQQASYVDMTWSRPYIFSLFNGTLTEYELEYCKLDVTGDVNKCTEWDPAIAGCASPIAYDGQTTYNCREVLASNNPRYQSKDFYVYRVRGVADKGTCVGGDNDGLECPLNDCTVGGGTCDLFKSTWAYSNVFRICPVGTTYEERRPQ